MKIFNCSCGRGCPRGHSFRMKSCYVHMTPKPNTPVHWPELRRAIKVNV